MIFIGQKPSTSAIAWAKACGASWGMLWPTPPPIVRCAYFDYQRDKVYLRTSPAMRRSLRRKQQAAGKRPKVNEEIECGKPDVCPACASRNR